MILLCDTNIFLQTNIRSHITLMRMFIETQNFFLGLDGSGMIWGEYKQFERQSRHLWEINNRILANPLWHTVDLKIVIPNEAEVRLKNLIGTDSNSTFQGEVNLLRAALANSDSEAVLVCTDSRCRRDTLPISRRLIRPDMIDSLKNHFPDLRVQTCDEIVEELRLIPPGLPRDWNTLEVWLDNYKRREWFWIEFKAPKQGLYKEMCRDIAKAVCAMLNTTTGYVIVGVDEDDNARIKGFKKRIPR